jgi:hypothetical protein
MAEYLAHFVVQTLFWPVRMLMAQTRRFHFSRRPVKPLRQTKPPRTGYRAQSDNLFGTGLFIRQHESIMRQKKVMCNKRVCFRLFMSTLQP